MKAMRAVVILAGFVLAVASINAQANYHTYTFTGIGVNGTQAAGSFVIDANSLEPFYSATGGIYPSISVTLTNIPGGGPSTVTFDTTDIQATWLVVDGGGTVFVGPYGSYSYGLPGMEHYDFGQPSRPGFPGSFYYETTLSYNGGLKDTITWSAAVLSSVPEPSTYAAIAGMVTLAAVVIRRRKLA